MTQQPKKQPRVPYNAGDMDAQAQFALNVKFAEIIGQIPEETALIKITSIHDRHFFLVHHKSLHYWGWSSKVDDQHRPQSGSVCHEVNQCFDRQLAWMEYVNLIAEWVENNTSVNKKKEVR